MEDTFSFSGHQSFPFRNSWLTKGVVSCHRDPAIFSRDDAIVTLGVGKNMVQSIRHWCLAMALLEEDPEIKNNRGRRLRPTELGLKLFLTDGGWDPYLEDIGTLWLLHWLLATNSQKATTWYFAFNALHQPEFTRSSLEQAIALRYQGLPSVRFTQDTLRRDVDVFVRTYVGGTGTAQQSQEDSLDCPLAELRLLLYQPAYGVYAFARGPKDTLPDAVLLYALWDYARKHSEQRTFTFDQLEYAPQSPGRVFKLDESALGERLDRIASLTDGAWQFSETIGLKQLLITGDFYAPARLADYYTGTSVALHGAKR